MASNSIFPTTTSAGALAIRDAAGAPIFPAAVENAYVPAPVFVSSCPLTALPSDCTARVEPRQLNAIVSELLSFAECLDPNGLWDCNSFKNLCAAFTQWAAVNAAIGGVIVSDTPPVNPPSNQLWWESDTGFLFLWYDDGTSTQWVQIAGDKVYADKVSVLGDGTVNVPFSVGLVDCGVW